MIKKFTYQTCIFQITQPCFSNNKNSFKSIKNVVCFTFKVRTSLLPNEP